MPLELGGNAKDDGGVQSQWCPIPSRSLVAHLHHRHYLKEHRHHWYQQSADSPRSLAKVPLSYHLAVISQKRSTWSESPTAHTRFYPTNSIAAVDRPQHLNRVYTQAAASAQSDRDEDTLGLSFHCRLRAVSEDRGGDVYVAVPPFELPVLEVPILSVPCQDTAVTLLTGRPRPRYGVTHSAGVDYKIETHFYLAQRLRELRQMEAGRPIHLMDRLYGTPQACSSQRNKHLLSRGSGDESVGGVTLLLEGDAKSIVDLGCGTGRNAAKLLSFPGVKSVVGLDVTQEMVEVAKTREELGRALKGGEAGIGCFGEGDDMTTLAFVNAQGGADGLISTLVLKHVSSPDTSRALLGTNPVYQAF
ncbi:hypothetical protein C8F01DRAFT_1089731 [Mycena amicta]|nr:hypothetical protein C8F01DRAFT_1089731 [Mycena amicta]